jgi:hypothetical protein
MTGASKTATPPTEWSETRNIRWKIEIPGRGSASPVVWGDRVYLPTAVPVGVTGEAAHAPRGDLPRVPHKYTLLAIDRKLGDGFDASPALVDGELYLRGNKFLYCIAEK